MNPLIFNRMYESVKIFENIFLYHKLGKFWILKKYFLSSSLFCAPLWILGFKVIKKGQVCR